MSITIHLYYTGQAGSARLFAEEMMSSGIVQAVRAEPGNERLPGNLNISFKGIEGETLLIILDMNGICASAGSACNTGEPGISHVIESIGVPKEYADGTIRFTLGEENTVREVDFVMDILKTAIKVLRE